MPQHRSTRNRFSWAKAFLVIFVIACVLAIIWSGYLLYTHRLSGISAIVILAITVGVLIWNISLMRAYRVGVGAILAACVVTALLVASVGAFAGIEPLASAKGKVVGWAQNLSSQIKSNTPVASEVTLKEVYENYTVDDKQMSLRTVDSWQGSESSTIRFEIDKSPWVVNWSYEPISDIAMKFNIIVIPESEYDPSIGYDYFKQGALAFLGMAWAPGFDGEKCIVVPRSGDFVILVDASGVKWWVKVGVE